MIIEIRDEVVSLSGAVRANQWAALESAVKLRLRHHPSGIVLDCSGIDAMTAEGAHTIRDAAAHVAGMGTGARLVLAAAPPHVIRVLRQVPNLGSQVPVAATVEEARRSLGLTPSVPRPGAPVAAAGRGVGAGGVLVGLLGSDADAHAAAVGCRIASATAAADGPPNAPAGPGAPGVPRPRLYLVRLLQVPRDRPLLSALGPEEEEAAAALERIGASVRAAGLLPVPRLERTRNAAARLVELADDQRAAVVVLSLGPDASDEEVSVVERVVVQARCEVVVDRLRRPGDTGGFAAADAGGKTADATAATATARNGRRAATASVQRWAAALLRGLPLSFGPLGPHAREGRAAR